MTRLLAAVALGAAACAATAQDESDWERANAERLRLQAEESVQPPRLARAKLVPLDLPGRSAFRFSVDAGSVTVGADGTVRYVMVATSPSGAENVTFEGLRCPDQYRIYAVLQSDGRWSGRAGEWRAVPRDARLGQYALARRYFCPAGEPIADARQGVAALQNGGHDPIVPRPAD